MLNIAVKLQSFFSIQLSSTKKTILKVNTCRSNIYNDSSYFISWHFMYKNRLNFKNENQPVNFAVYFIPSLLKI